MKKDPTAFLKEEYQKLVEQNLNWKLRVLEGPSAPRSVVEGKKVIMLCSNNYLNLSNHPRLIKAAKDIIDTHGVGSGSVRAIAGNMDIHEKVEKALARFKGREAALVYQTGFAANSGLIPQLVDKGDLIISDELNHGSIIDGVRLSGADKAIFKHRDYNNLEKVLKEVEKENYRRTLIVTDGVFSMDGDIARMDLIVELAEEFGAISYVDDAHGEGVLGENGKGIADHFDLGERIHVEMGTFSKAYGVVGGLIAGSQDLVNFAYNKSRTWLLSASHPPQVAAAQLAAIEVLENEPEHWKRLWDSTKYFKKELKGMGFDTGESETPITPVIVGESSVAKALSNKLYENGVFALPIVFPMVAKDKARIRTIMNAGLTDEDLNEALGAFEKCGKELDII
ncbi:MAG: glycine C-acetyltransferase [Candidatus Methanofastidiosia archaeon]|jgi:glycine C-acetyltransferase